MKKRIFSLILAILMVLLSFPITAFAVTDSFADELKAKGFPESYIPALTALHTKYPNWKFEALITNEDFSYAVSQERKTHSQQLIEKYSVNDNKGFYCTCASCYKNGTYVIQEAPNWVSASQTAVEYYMDPRNFLDEKYIFQFEKIDDSSNQTKEGVEKILAGTWMYNSNITYKDKNGKTVTYSPATKYSEAIIKASEESGVSAYYLASKIVQEVGGSNPTAGGVSGTYKGYAGIYNYYNINASSGVEDGLYWASLEGDGDYTNTDSVKLRKGPSTSTEILATLPRATTVSIISETSRQSDGYTWYNVSVNGKSGYIRSDLIGDNYSRPWTNPYLSIVNGAKYIADSFGATQNTGYLQKFNVNPASSDGHSHEYMANVSAAATEAYKTYTAFSGTNALSGATTFLIPVYNNMQLTAPTLKATVNATGTFTLSWSKVTGATSYEVYLQNADGTYKLLKSTTATSLTTAVAAYGKTYTYKVRALSNSENFASDYSATVSATNTKKLQTPTMKATVNTTGTFKLSWNAIAGATSYQVYLKNADGSYKLLKTTTATSLTTAVATYGKSYTYKVRAITSKNSSATSAYSATVTATNTKKLQTPTLKATVNANGSFKLSWNKITGATSYKVYLKNANGTYKLLKTTTGTSITTGVAAYGKSYTYKVLAVKGSVTSAYSATVTAKNSKKLQTPSGVKAVTNKNGSFTISWNKVTGATSYQVYVLDSKTNKYKLLKTTTSNKLTTGVAAKGKTYKYKVRALTSKNSSATSAYSSVLSKKR